MSKEKMRLAMIAGKTLGYPGSSGLAWYDKTKPERFRFRFSSDVAEEEMLGVGWEWPDLRIREERKELAP